MAASREHHAFSLFQLSGVSVPGEKQAHFVCPETSFAWVAELSCTKGLQMF